MQVVLKKLAHNNELSQLDKNICDRHHGEASDMRNCEVPEAVINLIEKYKIENQNPEGPIILNGETIGKGSDLLLCPSHRKMDHLINAAAKFSRGQHHTTILANILTMILLNPEPLLLQVSILQENLQKKNILSNLAKNVNCISILGISSKGRMALSNLPRCMWSSHCRRIYWPTSDHLLPRTFPFTSPARTSTPGNG